MLRGFDMLVYLFTIADRRTKVVSLGGMLAGSLTMLVVGVTYAVASNAHTILMIERIGMGLCCDTAVFFSFSLTPRPCMLLEEIL